MRALPIALIAVLATAAVAQEDPKLVPLQKAYAATKKAYLAKPKDAKVRKAFVKAATVYGHESMVSQKLGTRVKYRQALAVYREVLKIEPNHPVARPEYDLIVSIYKQMGRPVPK